ncbi:hypothetical protein J132_04173 [Termitomyces sp. J132]|nr:hypothetical protein C0989_001047 [Termitomyces sp. Mn162]KNZ82213.1 hypothetical protein J132_04173 [Termitomyces sp. J132]
MLRVLDEHIDKMDTSVVDIITVDLNRTKQTVEGHAGHLMQNKVNIVALQDMVDSIQSQLQISSLPIQLASSTSSLPPVLAPTLAPIAEAEEPNKDKAQPKENESQMNQATAVDLSTVADDSIPISNPITSVANSSVSSKSAPPEDSALTGDIGAGVTNSVIVTRPTAGITDSILTTRPAASNESTVPTGVSANEPAIPSGSILASSIAATRQLMDVI